MTAPSPSVPSRTPGTARRWKLIAKFKTSHPEAASAELESIDADNHVAILSDRTVMSVNGDDRRKVVNLLASQCKPSAGEQVDDYWSRQYPGFHMVEFHPYEGQAIFERLTKEQVRARNIIASKLGIKRGRCASPAPRTAAGGAGSTRRSSTSRRSTTRPWRRRACSSDIRLVVRG